MPATFTSDDLLACYPPPIQHIVTDLSAILRQGVPEATVRANPGWRSISFRHPRLGYFCGIFPFVDSVQLIFEFGVLLPDPAGELLGDGKQVRYLSFGSAADVNEEQIMRFVHASLDLPEDVSVRRALVAADAKPA